MIEKISIVDLNSEMIDECKAAFRDYQNVEVMKADFFSVSADLMVSPANSFGFMDGGLDLAIRNRLGVHVEEKVKQAIQTQFFGELPIGSSLIIDTMNTDWPKLGVAPTMRVPMNINGTLNVYYAFRSIFSEIIKFNRTSIFPINSVVCPGMGTGIGGLSERTAAQQMAFAYNQLLEGSQQKPARQRWQENSMLESLR